jgi:dihydroneopterin aldolase
MDRIFLEGIELYAWGGASEAEQRVGQRYRVDIVLETDVSRAARSDSLADTIDYARVYEIVCRLARQRPFHLLESVAVHIAEALLAELPVAAVTVRFRKLLPPLDGVVSAAGVEVRRAREE